MFSLRQPTDDDIRRALDAQSRKPFTYAQVGAIEGAWPAGFLTNRVKVPLGTGKAVFDAAATALRNWRQFDVDWVRLCWPSIAPEPGAQVGILARACGVWALSVSRIVAVIDECDASPARYAIIYGTLPQHVECGEERFQIEWNRDDDTVWYDVQAFYRPHHPLVRWTWPLTRRFPRKFLRESAEAMRRAVHHGERRA
ncbi:MAG: DUF1990 domain-containing protein [Planctomycetaceae bacterium]|nr:DUF1990 domain-containing protein [Planctomycetaceae bacterium]